MNPERIPDHDMDREATPEELLLAERIASELDGKGKDKTKALAEEMETKQNKSLDKELSINVRRIYESEEKRKQPPERMN